MSTFITKPNSCQMTPISIIIICRGILIRRHTYTVVCGEDNARISHCVLLRPRNTTMFFLWTTSLLYLLDVTLLVRADVCPFQCDCREDHLAELGTTFVIYCGHKNLTRVPDFKSLVKVRLPKLVSVAYNRITTMNRTDFPPGLGITILNLDGNRNLAISDDTFFNVRSTLIHLTLEATGLFFNRTLTFLKDLNRLKKLDLSYNNIILHNYNHGYKNVRDALFKGQRLTSLTYLKMYGCGIVSMGADVFHGLNNLQTLDIAANRMTDIPEAIRHLKNLKTLDISNCKINHLRGGRFIGMKKLTKIKLNYNCLNIIESSAFKGLETSLKNLELRGCKLTTIPTHAIKKLKILKSLNLASNSITVFDSKSLAGSYCLNELDLSNMKIKFRQDMFDGQKSCLTDLKLRNTSLSSVPLKPLSKLSNLRYLFLDNNFIKVLKKNAFKGIKAQTLSFSSSPLKAVETGAFNGVPRPIYLRIERTNVTNLQFFFDYKENTFAWIGVRHSSILCDCTLARIMNKMPDSGLYGDCRYDGRQLHFRSSELTEILSSECPAAFTSAPKPIILKSKGETTTFRVAYSASSSTRNFISSNVLFIIICSNFLPF